MEEAELIPALVCAWGKGTDDDYCSFFDSVGDFCSGCQNISYMQSLTFQDYSVPSFTQ